jgi:[NiFe] hydrogenase diaphorase moiety large subunit
MTRTGPIDRLLARYPKDASCLIDIVRDVQASLGSVPPEAVAAIAAKLGLSTVDVGGVVTFYHFFSPEPAGVYAVYLNTSLVSEMKGAAEVAAAFEREVGCPFGSTTPDGRIGLHKTSCIGMNDQEPAALINGIVFTKLTKKKVKEIVGAMKAGRDVRTLARPYGDGANRARTVKAMVRNNIRKKGPVLFAPFPPGAAVKKASTMSPEEVIAEVKKANLLGRGGAGFPTGLKWDFCRREAKTPHYVVGNADEGEPGTFKDRVILTELPHLLFEGMAVAGYAVGAREGVLYLRGEYAYLRTYLEKTLASLRAKKILGRAIAGKRGFDFDVTIKIGAGAYVCGEESALLESAEGKRGEPRDRPPFPVQFGYNGLPTTVNNVETLCAAARILEQGSLWFRSLGTPKSTGTKLLSVSGDCKRPGVYEVEFGLAVQRLLEMAGGLDAQAVQVGGPSGQCIPRGQFDRRVAFEDLATGGSIIVIGPQRDLFDVIRNFMDFFIDESCGWCVPCRAGNPLLKSKLEKIVAGRGATRDLAEIEAWGKIIKTTSRCGLGQTSPNPILTTLQNFRELFEAKIDRSADYVPDFDLGRAVQAATSITGQTLPESHHE